MSQLGSFLNTVFDRYHRPEYLYSDPLEFVHRYSDPWDQEAVALVSALLAYGNVKQIRRSVKDALGRMEAVAGSPRRFVETLDPDRPGAALRAFRGFVHRFNVGEDLSILFALLAASWKEHGSLGGHFARGLDPGDRDFSRALDTLIRDWRARIGRTPVLARLKRVNPSFSYLLTAPEDGSCCKRWCMFLRWMGRRDTLSLDPGLWTRQGALASTIPKGRWLKPGQLIMPLDTHTGRISQSLGLTRRKSINWLAAVEVTESLRNFDSSDPVKYDFALSRLGILDLYQKVRVSQGRSVP